MSGEQQLVSSDDLRHLLERFAAASFRPRDADKTGAENVQGRCLKLFSKDYPRLALIPNENGELSSSYPSTIIVPQTSTPTTSPCPQHDPATTTATTTTTTGDLSFTNGNGTSANSNGRVPDTSGKDRTTAEADVAGCTCGQTAATGLDANKLRELMARARVARCRCRFPVPVILLDGKYICRSATLSGGPEIYGRSGLDLLFSSDSDSSSADKSSAAEGSDSMAAATRPVSSNGHVAPTSIAGTFSSLTIGDSSQIFNKVRSADINLLNYLSVSCICDLMVEKKKVKFGLNITSSEKADKEGRYATFELLSLPYPGCEFFRDYRDHGYVAEGLVFDWSQHFVDATLVIPEGVKQNFAEIDWTHYKNWDILRLTKNYLKLLIHHLSESNSSLLVHCISGWDRTPLFISLLRLSLWADGRIHANLSPVEILYLTLAYDWYLFGHNLSDRISKGEEILFFCFYFLKFITTDDYSIERRPHRSSSVSSLTPAFSAQRGRVLSNAAGFDTLEDCLIEEDPATIGITATNFMGSLTSLNSTSSIGSVRSGSDLSIAQLSLRQTTADSGFDALDGICPPSMVQSSYPSSSEVYPRTPPTLTNSEEGESFLGRCSAADDDGAIETLIAFRGQPQPTAIWYDEIDAMALKENVAPPVSPAAARHSAPAIATAIKSDPMEIPVGNRGYRKSHSASITSRGRVSLDGWQIVTETGSIRETGRGGFYSSPDSHSSGSSSGRISQQHRQSAAEAGTSHDSSGSAIRRRNSFGRSLGNSRATADSGGTSSSTGASPNTRKEKLQLVRSLFYNAYSAAIGYNFSNGFGEPSSGFTTFVQHLGVGTLYSGGSRITAPN